MWHFGEMIRTWSDAGPGSVRERGEFRTLEPGDAADLDFTRLQLWDGFWWADGNADILARRHPDSAVFTVLG